MTALLLQFIKRIGSNLKRMPLPTGGGIMLFSFIVARQSVPIKIGLMAVITEIQE